MFGIDWDGDGEEGLLDDMLTLDIIEDDERNDHGGGKHNGSCLMFLIGMSATIVAPIALISKLIV